MDTLQRKSEHVGQRLSFYCVLLVGTRDDDGGKDD